MVLWLLLTCTGVRLLTRDGWFIREVPLPGGAKLGAETTIVMSTTFGTSSTYKFGL